MLFSRMSKLMLLLIEILIEISLSEKPEIVFNIIGAKE